MTPLHQSLARGPVEVRFVKADGSVRIMLATTNTDHFTYESRGAYTPPPANVIRVWDLMESGWRSIRTDRVLGWTVAS